MHISVEASLKKLKTSYIDIYYVHWWDHYTSVEEVMNGLHNLVTQGKVLYLVRFPRTVFGAFTKRKIREYPIRLLGSYLKLTNMLGSLEKLLSLFIKEPGLSCSVTLNVTSSLCAAQKVSYVHVENSTADTKLQGMGLAPWNVIAGGRLRSDAEEKKREESGEAGRSMGGRDWKRTEVERKVSNALEQVSKELGGGYSVSAGKSIVNCLSMKD